MAASPATTTSTGRRSRQRGETGRTRGASTYTTSAERAGDAHNPLHPDDERAAEADRELREAIRLADRSTRTPSRGFRGCPPADPTTRSRTGLPRRGRPSTPTPTTTSGGSPSTTGPTSPPLRTTRRRHRHRDAPEHARLRAPRDAEAPRGTNERIGANFDPSHLYWQDISITDAIRFLGEADAIHHFHAKDTKVYESESRIKGVLDTTSYADTADRSWLFRSIGYGHDEGHWKDVVSTLRMVGYEGALSIEHEDALTSSTEGLEKAVDVLSRAVFETQPGDAYWAE